MKKPLLFEVVSVVIPVAMFSAVTVAFSTTAPLESVTVPWIAAVVTWHEANGTLTKARKLLIAIELNANNVDRIRKKRMIALQSLVKWGTNTFKWNNRNPSLILLGRVERSKNFESKGERLAKKEQLRLSFLQNNLKPLQTAFFSGEMAL
jgi:hypothetical protein